MSLGFPTIGQLQLLKEGAVSGGPLPGGHGSVESVRYRGTTARE